MLINLTFNSNVWWHRLLKYITPPPTHSKFGHIYKRVAIMTCLPESANIELCLFYSEPINHGGGRWWANDRACKQMTWWVGTKAIGYPYGDPAVRRSRYLKPLSFYHPYKNCHALLTVFHPSLMKKSCKKWIVKHWQQLSSLKIFWLIRFIVCRSILCTIWDQYNY